MSFRDVAIGVTAVGVLGIAALLGYKSCDDNKKEKAHAVERCESKLEQALKHPSKRRLLRNAGIAPSSAENYEFGKQFMAQCVKDGNARHATRDLDAYFQIHSASACCNSSSSYCPPCDNHKRPKDPMKPGYKPMSPRKRAKITPPMHSGMGGVPEKGGGTPLTLIGVHLHPTKVIHSCGPAHKYERGRKKQSHYSMRPSPMAPDAMRPEANKPVYATPEPVYMQPTKVFPLQ